MEATQSRVDAPGRSQGDATDDAKAEVDEETRFAAGGPMTERRTIISKPMISRRAAIGGGLAGLGGLLLFPGQVLAKGADHRDSFVILLKGVYQPVVHGPNLGLSTVDLTDGSYSLTKVYRVKGTHEDGNRRRFEDHRIAGPKSEHHAIGDFYVQFTGNLCAYDLAGGTMAMRFTSGGFTNSVPDGHGGQFLEGTFELTVIEATRKFRPFVGGHNHMVDRLHALPPGDGTGGYDEFCFCYISRS